MYDFILTLYVFMWFALIGLAVLFIFSGIDDVLIDLLYWVHLPYRLWKMSSYKPLTYKHLLQNPEKAIAVLVPCWHEANVIGNMLRHNCSAIDYKNYIIFVGVYPNDLETVAEVEAVAKIVPHVQCVIGEKPGPTNKAENLNRMYDAAKTFEKKQEVPFEIILFHDSEDVIHPLSFKLYNHLIPRKDMIQLPVFPMETSYWNMTHWLYADEFSENHTKNIIVREAMKLHVPSAGVGTAFSRRAIEALALEDGTHPFSESSLTEDYRTSYIIRERGFKQIFLTQGVRRTKWVKRGIFRKRYVKKLVTERIATRAMFPTTYFKAVRQKSRWIIGIVFQEWEHTSWPKSWRLRYSLAHDRKAFITHFINGFAYIILLFWLFYGGLTYRNPIYPSLQERFNLYPWVWAIVLMVTFMMFMRILQRVIATTRVYGILAACLTIPRACYGNILNLHALIRAYRLYFVSVKNKTQTKPVAWDKTDHSFPGRHLLVPYRQRLGDLLVEQKLITEAQLTAALIECQSTGDRIGDVLVRLGMISLDVLLRSLGKQYALPIVQERDLQAAVEISQKALPKKLMRWFIKTGIVPVAVDALAATATLGIMDPTNEVLIASALKRMPSYKVDFVLINPSMIDV